jgi:hypothetical protein
VLELNSAEHDKLKEKYSLGAIASATNNNNSTTDDDSVVTFESDVVNYFAHPPLAQNTNNTQNKPQSEHKSTQPQVKPLITKQASQFTPDGNVTTKSHLFIIEIMSKITVNNVIKEAARRVTLLNYLKIQEHRLLLQYGGAEYLAAERARQDKIIADKRAKLRLIATQKQSALLSIQIMKNVTNTAIWNARVFLFDPWSLLDLNPTTWLTKGVVDRVNYLFTLRYEANTLRMKKRIFHALAREYRYKMMIKRRQMKYYIVCFQQFAKHLFQARNIHKTANTIQHAIKHFLWRLRHTKYIEYQQICVVKASLLAHNE